MTVLLLLLLPLLLVIVLSTVWPQWPANLAGWEVFPGTHVPVYTWIRRRARCRCNSNRNSNTGHSGYPGEYPGTCDSIASMGISMQCTSLPGVRLKNQEFLLLVPALVVVVVLVLPSIRCLGRLCRHAVGSAGLLTQSNTNSRISMHNTTPRLKRIQLYPPGHPVSRYPARVSKHCTVTESFTDSYAG